MGKENEIEEFVEAIEKRLAEANLVAGSMNRGKGHWIAEGLFPTYRKADEVRKESAGEIERLKAALDDAIRSLDTARETADLPASRCKGGGGE